MLEPLVRRARSDSKACETVEDFKDLWHPPGSQRPLPCASGKFGSTTAAWRYLDVHASGKLGARVDESHRNAHSSRDAQLNSRHLRIVMDGVGWLTVAPRLESMCANVRRHGCSG